MSAWEEYPADYRHAEVSQILAASRAGECVSVVGLSGAGKSNLLGFLFHRRSQTGLRLILADCNRALPHSVSGLFRLTRQALGESEPAPDEYLALEAALNRQMQSAQDRLCLLFDRYDAFSEEERAQIAGPLRSLRDGHKYQLSFVIATRRPLGADDELAELFYAHTLWLGPLDRGDALWSAAQYAARRSLAWDEDALARLVDLSWGYPALLRACCEAYSLGAALDLAALRGHPVIQRRVQEFWSDHPGVEDLRRSGLTGQPLLASAPTPPGSPDLTASEHRLLAFFQTHAGVVCAKDDLIRAVWPEDRVLDGLRDDSLAQLIRRLRQKIETDSAKPQHIQTIPGRGYRYIP
jgi:hypothetical protein